VADGGGPAVAVLGDRRHGRSWGRGLARELAARDELVIELDRPHRRNGAKSDPLDAIRAGREARLRRTPPHPAWDSRDRERLAAHLVG
jgi:transposase